MSSHKYIIKKAIRESIYDSLNWIDEIEPSRKVKDKSDEIDIIYNYIRNLMSTYNGWEIFPGHTVDFTSKKYPDVILYATPQWDNENEVPVDIDGDFGYRHLGEITIPKLDYEIEVIEWVKNVYIPTVIKRAEDYLSTIDQ